MIEKIKKTLKNYFRTKPIHKAYLFGSLFRKENTPLSDIDVLVELDYENGANYFLFYDMQQELSKLFDTKVDLISANGLSPHIKPIINSKKLLIYNRKNPG